ncbi:fasciclin domain-containing protein [Elioraea sp.]|uniref:fasciclin domain-containing protein n=1 Tax=Elioraea sp. TaxID=2185103 RepID=UPI0025C65089|nr:fasciclin domain-containing protein [Elioraea sp.]
MNHVTVSRRLAVLGGGALVLAACGSSSTTQTAAVTQQRDLMTVIASNSDLERFTDGLRRTGADQLLRGQGTYTVFAPTNSGWGSIPAQIRNDVLPPNAPADPIRGRALMVAHIVEGRHTVASLAGRRTTLMTVNGNRVIIDATNTSRVTVESDGGGGFNAGGGSIWGASTVTTADMPATNGIVHIVDKAVLP